MLTSSHTCTIKLILTQMINPDDLVRICDTFIPDKVTYIRVIERKQY